jgi:hypothetical protein
VAIFEGFTGVRVDDGIGECFEFVEVEYGIIEGWGSSSFLLGFFV